MIETEQHNDMVLLLPAVAIMAEDCGNPACGARHWRFSLGWLVWSVHFTFE